MASCDITPNTKFYTREEVAKHNHSNDLWFIINNKVYDVTKFTNHPGGEEILLEQAGRDCTQEFEDIGHSRDAIDLMVQFKVGEVTEKDITQEDRCELTEVSESDSSGDSWRSWLIPIALGVLATVVYRYFIKAH